MTEAWPPGTRVRKTRMRPGDTHQIGEMATVVRPFGPAIEFQGRQTQGYLVQWDDLPGIYVFVIDQVLEANGGGGS